MPEPFVDVSTSFLLMAALLGLWADFCLSLHALSLFVVYLLLCKPFFLRCFLLLSKADTCLTEKRKRAFESLLSLQHKKKQKFATKNLAVAQSKT